MPPKSAAPKSAKKEDKKKVEKVSLPSKIRRNYLTRTYSGDNLRRSDNLSQVQKLVSKVPLLLCWENKRMVSEFPNLSRLDFKVEMKLLDIILGEDPLCEGTTSQEMHDKRSKMANKNLQEALSLAGRKRVLLLERFANLFYNKT